MISFEPKEVTPQELQGYLQTAVAPRPIAFASTLDSEGNPNLSPFSFFNVFSSNPPIVVFSPARRVRNNTVKHTLLNVQDNGEVVINIVNFAMVQQVSLASTEYADGVNEFEKAGFTMIPSDNIKPFRVAEAPVQMECKVQQIIALGDEGGAGNLVICEVVKMHVSKEVLGSDGKIDQHKIDLVSRLGGNWYSRANAGLFEVEKPLTTLGIGVDNIPMEIRNSEILDGNDLGKLGNIEVLPTQEEINIFVTQSFKVKGVLSADDITAKHQKAKDYLNNNDVLSAWKVLLATK
ncbi:flavin reductase family protein [Flavobacterium ardleyense]|uniref:flavin reductase family protein n=1 Tax=Flavobacterium ardleyense TaxID=2038737 RepID=UPI00298BFF88|nr:flavin reductase family protein [Flavobacterium ardleyense]